MRQIEKLYGVLTDAINANKGVEDCVIITARPNEISILFWTSMVADDCFIAKFNGNSYFIDEFHIDIKNGECKYQMATPAGEEDEQTFFNMDECENIDELIEFINNIK